MNFISLFQQQQQQDGLAHVDTAIKKASQTALSLGTKIGGAAVGVFIFVTIVFMIILLVQAKYAGLEKKQQIYKRIKSAVFILGVIIVILVAGTSIMAAIQNLWTSFQDDLTKQADPVRKAISVINSQIWLF